MNIGKKIRLYVIQSLVFSFLLIGCAEKDNDITIVWEKDKAVGFLIPDKFVSPISRDSIPQLLSIRLLNHPTSILGEYNIKNGGVEFRPLIAFTRGLIYEVYVSGKRIKEIKIPAVDNDDTPTIIAVYPSADTLPENLLKFYIQFSKPMQEGEALDHIRLIKNGTDTLSSVFLDLQPELWNNERTMLTLWLDPGRIKRDLQPNKLLGPPLHKGENYQLLIHHNWQDANGVLLKEDYQKNFFTGIRDSLSPDPDLWTIQAPKPGTEQQLIISFHELLDYVLAKNTIQVMDADDNILKGAFEINDKGDELYFIPMASWKPGIYIIEIEPRLEDLAGNNLNHLFDTDLTQKQHNGREVYKRLFKVQ